MIVFISSTFRDLYGEREAVEDALRLSDVSPWGMELFVSSPQKPLDVCLENLRASAAVVVIVGARSGSFVPGSTEVTYTKAEVEEARQLRLPIFAFLLNRNGAAPNDETDPAKRAALGDLRRVVEDIGTPAYFENPDQLKFEVLTALHTWTDKGRPGARKTFASSEEYFAEYCSAPGRSRLFDFSQTLVGRQENLASLEAFVAAPNLSVAILTGRGGIGKTRLLKEFADKLDGHRKVSFLRRGAIWHRESEKELPTGDLIIIADDGHRNIDLTKLLQCLKDAQESNRSAKLIISSRPRSLDSVNGALADNLDSTLVYRMPPLGALSTTDVRRLAKEELGPHADPGVLEWLVSISADTPLVTVAAARLIRSKNIHPSEMKSDDDFQHIVFDRFIDELDEAAKPFPTRRLVELAAALGPESFGAEPLVADVAAYLKVEVHEIHLCLYSLEEKGLLICDASGGFRVAPDVLSDSVLERCSVTGQRSSGFADFVIRRFGPHGKSGQILDNFGEIDWRISQKSNGELSILKEFWSELVGQFRDGDAGIRCEILATIRKAAFYKPEQALEVCEIARSSKAPPGGDWWPRTNDDVLKALPEILGLVSHHHSFASQSLKLLFDLWRKGVSGASDEAKRLAKLRPVQNQPPRTEKLLDAIGLVLHDRSFYKPERSILDLVDEILEREIEWTISNETTIELTSYSLNYSAFMPMRQRCIRMLDSCLGSTDVLVALRALRSLITLLHPTVSRFGRRDPDAEESAWQDEERLDAVRVLTTRSLDLSIDLTLQQQIFASLRRRDWSCHGGSLGESLTELQAAMPNSEKFSSFDGFMTPYWSWEPIRSIDLETRQAHYFVWIRRVVDRFVAAYPSPAAQIAQLEDMMLRFQRSGLQEKASDSFIDTLIQRHPPFASAFIDYVSNSPMPALAYDISLIVRPLRAVDPDAYGQLCLLLACHPTFEVALGVANGMRWPVENGATNMDLDIIECLARHPELSVRLHARSLAGRAGRLVEHSSRAAGILAITRVEHPEPGWIFWGVVGPDATPIDAFTEGQMRSFLMGIVACSRIDRSKTECGELFEGLSSRWPHLIAELLTNRLEFAATKGPEYSPWGGINIFLYFQSMAGSPHLPGLLRRIRDLSVIENVPKYDARELFWAVGGDDALATQILNEWTNEGSEVRRELARMFLQTSGKPRYMVQTETSSL